MKKVQMKIRTFFMKKVLHNDNLYSILMIEERKI